jgi:4-oxalocrotonate tautomerase
MPVVTIQQSPRDPAQKESLVAGITEAFVAAYGVHPEQVLVFIHEVDDENWGNGGTLRRFSVGATESTESQIK